MNTDLRKETKNDLKNIFLSWWKCKLGKTMENITKHRDIKLTTKERRRDYLVSELNYHTTKFFTEHLLAIERKKQRYLWVNLSI